MPIHEQPVTWIEDTDSRVKIVKTAVDDLKGLYRVNKELDKRSWFEKWTLPVLLVLTGVLYLFGALHNGMANSYYAAAVQATSVAWLFEFLNVTTKRAGGSWFGVAGVWGSKTAVRLRERCDCWSDTDANASGGANVWFQ